ncbi:MAG: SRPBCC domain-containing protein [Chitinophagaceae bacterium]|nr:MAG: SRPBCC domain-containing protein [Chitinophagaceae bacterium]
MDTKQFTITINAPKEKVWNALWNDANYRKWTSVFNEGSYMEAAFLTQGADVRFLNPEGNGMYSIIDTIEPNRIMIFRHLGVVKDQINQPPDEESKKWAGGQEKYFLDESNGITTLTAEVDVYKDFETYFNDTFPKALQAVKEIAEADA